VWQIFFNARFISDDTSFPKIGGKLHKLVRENKIAELKIVRNTLLKPMKIKRIFFTRPHTAVMTKRARISSITA